MSGIKTYVGSDGKLHFVDASGADSVLPFNSGVDTATEIYNTTGSNTVSYTNAEIGKTYLIIAELRWVGDGAINFNGIEEILNVKRSVLSSGMAWWHGFYTVIAKATNTTITATYTGVSDTSKSAFSLYELN